jgi:hypothetical protein
MAPKIYPAHSALNKIERPIVVERVDLQQGASSDSILKSIINKTFKVDSLSNTGPYKAVVLRIEDNNKPLPGSWVSSVFSNLFSSDTTPRFVQIKARIPEIHAALPIPATIGEDSEEHDIIELYPTFIGEKDTLPIPAVGTLVWVTFGNKTNFTDPIYLGPVVAKQPTSGLGAPSRGSESFSKLCPETTIAEAGSGNKVPGAALAVSHTGLVLGSRVVQQLPNKILKGERFSTNTVESWGKALHSAKIEGVSWVGNIVYNGATDSNHKEVKRDTILFAHSKCALSSPVELCYFLHDIGEFTSEDFIKRFVPAITSLIAGKRNIILVIPELPWSGNTINTRKNASLGTNDSLYYSHEEIVKTIKKYFSKDTNIKQTTMLGFGMGAGVIYDSLASIASIGVNKIALANVTSNILDDIATETSSDGIELNIFSQTTGLSSQRLDGFSVKKYKNVLVQKLNKTKDELGTYILTYVNRTGEDTAKKTLDGSIGNTIIDYDAEEAEGAYSTLVKINKAVNTVLLIPDASPPLANNWSISPMATVKKSSGTVIVAASPYTENRVRVGDYGSLSGNESILVNVPSSGTQQKVHKLVADRFFEMNRAWKQDYPAKDVIKIASGWRAKKTMSTEDFDSFLISKYGSVEEGRKYQAYSFPHETGLAFDIGNNGLTPNSKTNELQKDTELYKWLVQNAHKYGFSPYKYEAWHWECRVTKEAWLSGKEFSTAAGTYAVRVESAGDGSEGELGYDGAPAEGKNCVKTIGDGNMNATSTSDSLEILWNDFAKGSQENVGQLMTGGKKVMDKWGEMIDKYRINCPAAVLAVRIWHESRGNAAAAPTGCCGESGILQIWCGASFFKDRKTFEPGSLGATCNGKLKGKFNPFDAAQNLWGACNDLNRRSYKLKQKFGNLFPKADEQFWFLVMIEMNIGQGALAKLIAASNPRDGYALTDLNKWVYDIGSGLQKYQPYFGSQSAALIARRVLVIPTWVEAAKQLGTLEGEDFGITSYTSFAE